jgi:hypothetical protein
MRMWSKFRRPEAVLQTSGLTPVVACWAIWAFWAIWAGGASATASPQDELAPAPPSASFDPSTTLKGEGWLALTTVDVDTGRLSVFDEKRRLVARIPIGVALRPQWPPRTYAPAGSDSVLLMHAEPQAGDPAALENVVALLTEPEDTARASVSIRAGRYGPVLAWSLPKELLDGLSHAVTISGDGAAVQFGVDSTGRALRVGGKAAPSGLALRGAARLQFRVRDALKAVLGGDDLPAAGFRLTGRIALEDATDSDEAVDVSLSADGRQLRPVQVLRGAMRTFDVDIPVPPTEDLVLSVKPHATGSGALTTVLALRLDAGEGLAVDLLDVVRSARSGVDLCVDAAGGIEWDAAYCRSSTALEPAGTGAARVGLDPTGVVTFLPQLLVREADDGRCVGVGLTLLPDANTVALDGDRVAVALPTRLLATRGGGPGALTLSLAVIVAADRAQLLERYRDVIVEHGTSPVVRDLGNLPLPVWWRDPCIVVDPRTTPRFHDVALERALDDARAKLGLGGSTLVVDGPWYVAPGEPTPTDAFTRLAAITAQARLRGDHVVLAWDAFRVAPDSFGDVARVAEQGLLDTTSLSRTQDYVREITRRTLSRELDAIAADGLLLRGLDAVRDPQQSHAVHNPAAGVGVREIRRLLEIVAVEANRAQRGSWVGAAVGAPECIESLGMTWINRARCSDADAELAVLRLAAVQPDLPCVIGPRAGALAADFDAELRFLALSLFWIAQVDAWSEADARRVFGIVALGGTVAGIVGPQVSKWLYASLDVPIGGVVLLSVVLLEVAQWAARRGKSAADASTKPASDGNVGKEALEGIVATARSPYLLGIAGYLLLYSFTSTFLWFGKQHFSHIVYGDDDKAAAQFFANLRSISEGVTLALQLFVAGRFMNRFGVGIALCAVPVFTFAGFSSVWIAPTLQSLAIFEVGRQALQYAISRPAKEVLFTVVSRAEKSKAKAFIDTVVYRLGDAMAAGVKEHTSAEKGLFVPIPAAVVWTVVALVLGRAQAKRAAAEASTAASK